MKTILIVDDDFDMRDTLKDVLEAEGFDVAVAGDGIEALEYLSQHPPPSLILLDWMMPRCNGAEFRAQQRQDPTIASIPVVLLTADASARAHTSELEMADCLAKPVKLRRLLDVVRVHSGH